MSLENSIKGGSLELAAKGLSLISLKMLGRLDLNSQRIYPLKVFTSAPALAEMEVGEVAIGDGTGTTAEDEWFFKPDAAKIVALDHTGAARTITT